MTEPANHTSGYRFDRGENLRRSRTTDEDATLLKCIKNSNGTSLQHHSALQQSPALTVAIARCVNVSISTARYHNTGVNNLLPRLCIL